MNFEVLSDHFSSQRISSLPNPKAHRVVSYLLAPDLIGRAPEKVPLMHLLGTDTEKNKSTCVIVHRYFPYFFVKVEKFRCFFEGLSQKELASTLGKFAISIEEAFNVAFSKKAFPQIVYKILPKYKKDFYGYHRDKELFLKIFLYKPKLVRPIAAILSRGLVNGFSFPIYESHIEHKVKFYKDNNVTPFGNIFIAFEEGDLIAFRGSRKRGRPKKRDSMLSSTTHKFSRCETEIHIDFEDIVDRNELYLQGEDKEDQMLASSLKSFWIYQSNLREKYGLSPYCPPDKKVVFPTDPLKTDFSLERDNVKGFNDRKEQAKVWKSKTAESAWEDSVDYLKAVKFKDILSDEVEKSKEGFSSKFEFYKSRHKHEKKTLGKFRFKEERDAESSEEEIVLDGDRQKVKLDTMFSKDTLVQRFDDQGKMKVAQAMNRADSNALFDFPTLTKQLIPSVMVKTNRRVNKPDARSLEDELEDLESIIQGESYQSSSFTVHPSAAQKECTLHQFPFMDNLEDLLETKPSLKMDFVWGLSNSEVKKISGTKNFLAKVSRMLFEHKGLQTISIPNEWKLPDHVNPQNVNLHSAIDVQVEENEGVRYYKESEKVEDDPESNSLSSEEEPNFKILPDFDPILNSIISTQLSIISFELVMECGAEKLPNPDYDRVAAIFFSFRRKNSTSSIKGAVVDIRFASDFQPDEKSDLFVFENEQDGLEIFGQVIKLYETDILFSYDVDKFSLGYIQERCLNFGMNFFNRISTVSENAFVYNEILVNSVRNSSDFLKAQLSSKKPEASRKYFLRRIKDNGKGIVGIKGFSMWQVAKENFKLRSYCLESILSSLLKARFPIPSEFEKLRLLTAEPESCREYFRQLLDFYEVFLAKSNHLNMCVEFSKLYGISLDNIERGSQYKIEAYMLPICRQKGYLFRSSWTELVASQMPMAFKPYILEPAKMFFSDPVAVFDFQALYPSIMISHNMCYSTCLGKNVFENGETPIGFTSTRISLEDLTESDIIFAANDCAFVKKSVVSGIIPQILTEFLKTRIMLKESKKLDLEDNPALCDSQQSALKLFMNVIYGYTAAGFSGHMPCVELADAVVSTGRRLLHQSIAFIEGLSSDFKVIYGDTDSIFVSIRNTSFKDSFARSRGILEAIQERLIWPIELKLEKVYYPLTIFSKKRYTGMKFTSPNDSGVLEAKGTEVIRRDSSLLVSGTISKFSEILFRSKNLSKALRFLTRTLAKVAEDKLPLDYYILHRKTRKREYKIENATSKILEQIRAQDPMMLPSPGQRVQMLVVESRNSSSVRDTVMTPKHFLKEESFSINRSYYIKSMLAKPMNRFFEALGLPLSMFEALLDRSKFCQRILKQPKALDSNIMSFLLENSRFSPAVSLDSDKLATNHSCSSEGNRTLCQACEKDQLDFLDSWSQLEILQKKLERNLQKCSKCSPKLSRFCQSNFCPTKFKLKKVKQMISDLQDTI